MKFGMGPVGASGLLWLLATGCGDSASGSGSSQAATNTNGSNSSTTNSNGTSQSSSNSATSSSATSGTGSSGSATATSGVGGTNSGSCPSIEPAPGTSCSGEGLICAFLGCTPPEYRGDHTLSCREGIWVLVSEGLCQPANCPASAELGSVCDPGATPGPCPVISACGTVSALCSGGVWSTEPANGDVPQGTGGGSNIIIGPTCPAVAPYTGDACCPDQTPARCYYPDGQSRFAPIPVTGAGGVTSTTTTTAGMTEDTTGSGGAGATGNGGDTGTTGTGATGAAFPVTCGYCNSATQSWAEAGDCE